MLFEPSKDDKIINRAGRERIPVYLFIDPEEPSILYIQTKKDINILDNSIYDLTIPELLFDDDTTEKCKHTFITAPSPAYVDIDDVLKECRNIPVDKDIIIHHIKHASQIADYWAYHDSDGQNSINKKVFDINNIEEDYYPFYMFVKYFSVADSIKSFYMEAITKPYKFKDVLSDLEREEQMDLSAIKTLIDEFENEAKEWLEIVVTITADPQWALRGKYSYAITNQNYKPYHSTLIDKTGWSRGY